MPELSVVMTTHNENLDFLKTCIDSVLSQTYGDFQFFIVIEPDEKNEAFLINSATADNRVIIIKNEEKLGIAGSRNRAILQSSGKYIALIDSDDYCDSMRFEKQAQFLETNPEISVVGSNIFLIDSDNHIIGRRMYPERHKKIQRHFLKTMSIANPTVMTRRKDLYEIGLFDNQFPKAEDLDLWLRFLTHKKKMYNLQENLVYYRLPAKHFEKRSSQHYRYNYIARKRYSKFIWSFCERFFSLSGYFVISHVPNVLIKGILNHRIANRIKKVELQE